jgi:hypothetical protein
MTISTDHSLEIMDLSEHELATLEAALPAEAVSSTPPTAPEGDEHGDLSLLIAGVVVSVASITGVVIWATMNRKRVKLRITEKQTRSGSTTITELDFSDSTSSPAAIRQIGNALRLDQEALDTIQAAAKAASAGS